MLSGRFLQLRPHTARHRRFSAAPPFPLVSWAHLAKCFWHISRSLSCPKQPLYQNYPPEENQFVYLWRVLHIRHFKPRLACSFTEETSAGLKRVEEVDRCQQAKEQFKKRWPEWTSADRQHKCHKNYIYITVKFSVRLNIWVKLDASVVVEYICLTPCDIKHNSSHFQRGLYFLHFSIMLICRSTLSATVQFSPKSP